MTLNEAIEILKTERVISDLKISNGNGSKCDFERKGTFYNGIEKGCYR